MKRRTLLVYLCIPAVLAIGGFVVALQREPFGLQTISNHVVGGYLFYAAPYFLWFGIAALAKFSDALLQAGLIASTVALAAIVSVWFGPRDPSGLPIQWMLYWPLAVILQIIAGIGAAVYQRRHVSKRQAFNR
jgi:hypothetical protein